MPTYPDYLGGVIGSAMHWFEKGLTYNQVISKLRANRSFNGLPMSDLRAAASTANVNVKALNKINSIPQSQLNTTGRTLKSIIGSTVSNNDTIGVRIHGELVDPSGGTQWINIVRNYPASTSISDIIADITRFVNSGRWRSRNKKTGRGKIDMTTITIAAIYVGGAGGAM